jgi:calcineurin-like phosphoesterase family protein
MDRLQGMEVHCIVGNHDTYFKNTNEVNSPKELFGSRYPDFHIYDTPVELTFDNTKIAMIPWINKGNEQKSIDFINQTDATILAGHFELEGYQVIALIDFRQYQGRYVKVFVHEKKNAKKFDRLIEKLYENNAESVTILENETPTSEKVEVDKDALSTDTMTLISSYVDDVFSDDPEECKRLKDVFKELFLESFDV